MDYCKLSLKLYIFVMQIIIILVNILFLVFFIGILLLVEIYELFNLKHNIMKFVNT